MGERLHAIIHSEIRIQDFHRISIKSISKSCFGNLKILFWANYNSFPYHMGERLEAMITSEIRISRLSITLENVYVDLLVFTRIAGT